MCELLQYVLFQILHICLFVCLLNVQRPLETFLSTQISFPLAEFIIALGFFMVLILERIVICLQSSHADHEEREPLIQANGQGNGPGHITGQDLEGSGPHVHMDFQAHSSFRSFMLFLSLSFHSVFEGLAIGLQRTDSKVRGRDASLPHPFLVAPRVVTD